jgi:hypothetical protein
MVALFADGVGAGESGSCAMTGTNDELLVKVREAIIAAYCNRNFPIEHAWRNAAAEAIRIVREADAAKVQWYVDYANRQDKQVCDEMALANEALAWADRLRQHAVELDCRESDSDTITARYDAWRKGQTGTTR